MVRDGQGPGAASLASSGRRGPRRAAAFLYLLYTRPAKLYPVFIPVSLICLACAATASGCRARRSFREKNVDLVYLAAFAAMAAKAAALLQFCGSLKQGERA